MTPSLGRSILFLAIALPGILLAAQGQGGATPKLYNTAKQKILEGKQVFSFTQWKMDVEGYCEAAKHYDYAWFEMQHSTLEFRDVEKMIAACPHAGATPMIRLPDAQEREISLPLEHGNNFDPHRDRPRFEQGRFSRGLGPAQHEIPHFGA